jgi:hypothetical protein
VKSQVARDGWTPELIGRALTSLRIAGTVALGRPVGQTVVDRHASAREGQLAVRTGTLRRKRALVSTAMTPGAIAGALANGHALGARTQAILNDLHDSLRVLSTARYGRNGHLDTTALDTALDNSIDAMRRLRRAKMWPVRTAETIVKSAAELVGRA